MFELGLLAALNGILFSSNLLGFYSVRAHLPGHFPRSSCFENKDQFVPFTVLFFCSSVDSAHYFF